MLRLFLLCSSVLLSVLTVQLNADEHFPFLGQVSKSSVNVRSGPNINFEVIEQLAQDERVIVTGRHYEWFKVRLSSKAKAFIRADYLLVKDPQQPAEIIGDKVNVRCAPNSDSTSLGQLAKGGKVVLVVENNGWWQIVAPDEINGWVHQDFVRFVSDEFSK